MSVYREKSGRYRFSFNRVINGRRLRATKLLPKSWTHHQAQEYDTKETARLYAIGNGQSVDDTIDKAILLYLQNHAINLKGFTALEKEFNYNLEHYTGKKLTELNLVAQSINKLNISQASKRNYLANIRSACRYAWKFHGMGDKDPALNLKLPKVSNKREIYITRIEMLTIAKKVPVKYRAFIRIAFYTGMRIGEMLKAKVIDDIIYITDTKNGESRIIPIHDRIKSACVKHLPCKYAKITIQSNWQKAKGDAGMKHLHFHDLRHSTASEMINNGVDLHTIGLILGHKDRSSTQRYAHLLNSKLLEAVNKVGR